MAVRRIEAVLYALQYFCVERIQRPVDCIRAYRHQSWPQLYTPCPLSLNVVLQHRQLLKHLIDPKLRATSYRGSARRLSRRPQVLSGLDTRLHLQPTHQVPSLTLATFSGSSRWVVARELWIRSARPRGGIRNGVRATP